MGLIFLIEFSSDGSDLPMFETAAQGRIVTFGIHLTCAATDYGYIRPGRPLNGACVREEIEAFVEKPDAETASQYVANGHLWNSGLLPISRSNYVEGN